MARGKKMWKTYYSPNSKQKFGPKKKLQTLSLVGKAHELMQHSKKARARCHVSICLKRQALTLVNELKLESFY